MLFFGTVPESIQYFTEIGFPPPEVYTPTDIYLQVTDSNFGTNQDVDFGGSFACSSTFAKLNKFLDVVKRSGVSKSLKNVSSDDDQGSKKWSTLSKVKPQFMALGVDSDSSCVDEVEGEEIVTAPLSSPSRCARFCRQFFSLLKRDFTVAYRDPSLYYLQFVLVTAFGFLVGAGFLSTT